MDERRRYHAYLLRLWETSNGERQIWRASLESPGSGQRQGFASLQGLMEFLEVQIKSQDELRREPDAQGGAGGQRSQQGGTTRGTSYKSNQRAKVPERGAKRI